MSDYTELKRSASEAKNWGREVGEGRWYTAECFNRPYFSIPDAEFIAACDPGAVLALIAENEAMAEFKAHMVSLREANGFDSWAAVLVDLDRFKAENEALSQFIQGFAEYDAEMAFAYAAMGKGDQP